MDLVIHHQLLPKVRSYQMPPLTVELLKQHTPLIIAGATAAGKDAVAKRVQEDSDWQEVITHTTRTPRPGEVNGQHYWFVSEAEMLKLVETQAMIEAKVIHGDSVYGTSFAAYQKVLNAGRKPLVIIDVQGIREINKRLPSLRPVFILPPSFEAWMERLAKRGTMTPVERIRRLRSARAEMEEVLRNKHFTLVVNDELSKAAEEIISGYVDPVTQSKNRELTKQLIDSIKV